MQTRLYVVLFVGGSRIDDPLSFFFYFILFYFICYSKVRQLQQLQLLSQSIHAQTYYTPKHTCNSTITTQGNAYCYFTSAIQKRRN